MEQLFLQFGISGATLVALTWVVKAFLTHNKDITHSFKNTIDNHIAHSIETQQKLIDTIDKLSNKL